MMIVHDVEEEFVKAAREALEPGEVITDDLLALVRQAFQDSVRRSCARVGLLGPTVRDVTLIINGGEMTLRWRGEAVNHPLGVEEPN